MSISTLNGTAKRVTPSQATRYALAKFLDASLERLSMGYVKYPDGLDDPRVAEQFNVNITTVRKLRQELFGKTRAAKKERPAPVLDTDTRLAKLEERVQALYDSLGL